MSPNEKVETVTRSTFRVLSNSSSTVESGGAATQLQRLMQVLVHWIASCGPSGLRALGPRSFSTQSPIRRGKFNEERVLVTLSENE